MESRFWWPGEGLSWSFIWRSLDKLESLYRLDKNRPCLWGGYSLGGLTAVYSLFHFDKVSCIFSICGSFWYPDFTTYCRDEKVKNLDCLLYFAEWSNRRSHHTNRLAQAPAYAEQLHTSLQQRYPTGQFVFDPYGHHEQVAERFLASPTGWPKNGESNKKYPLVKPRDNCIFNQETLFLSGFQINLRWR